MNENEILIPPKELSRHYGFPYQTMLNWSKVDGYKFIVYKVLEKNMITELSNLTNSFKKDDK